MRPAPLLATLGIMIAGITASAAVDIHLGGYLGYKTGDSALEPVEKPVEYGVVAHVRPPLLPVGVSANWYQGRKDGDALTSGGVVDSSYRGNELQLGIGRVFDPFILVHPFIAGGATHATATLTHTGAVTSDDSGSAWGYWGHAGVYLTAGFIEIGGLVGYSRADVELGSEKINVGGTRVGVIMGLGF